jgi:hypothetical protein
MLGCWGVALLSGMTGRTSIGIVNLRELRANETRIV